jgi:SAM-dependent methyltransferase
LDSRSRVPDQVGLDQEYRQVICGAISGQLQNDPAGLSPQSGFSDDFGFLLKWRKWQKLKQINEVAKWGREWQKGGDWSPHSSSMAQARLLVPAYIEFVRVMGGGGAFRGQREGLDLGAGAGCIAAVLQSVSTLRMTASEWNDDGLNLIHRENPDLPARLIDLTSFDDQQKWDFILCRELYPFTRVNSFTDQAEMVSRIVDALKPGGVFLLVGSTASFPHCADYDLLADTFRKDGRVRSVSSIFLEAALVRFTAYRFLGRFGYTVANAIARVLLPLVKGRKWAAIGVVAFQKRGT